MSTLTRTGMVLGSPGFMSPEQAEGHEVGPPSDVFSLGAVLAFAATGHGPFGEGTTVELLFRVVNKDPDTHDLPAGIRPLIERCLVKDPLGRPTASRLLAELGTPPPTAIRPAGPAAALPTATVRAEPAAASRKQAVPGQRRDGYQDWDPTATVTPWRPAPAPAPVPAAPGGGATAQRRRPPRWPWLVGFATAVLVAAAVVFAAWRAGYIGGGTPAASRGTPPASASSQPTSPTATARPPGAVTMTALGSYLAQSATVRPTVQPAIDRVRSCAQSPSAGQAAMEQAISTRQHILTGLQGLSPAGLPNGAQLISTLTGAMQNSVSADQYYQNWMADFAAAGSPCGSDPSQNPNFAAGQEASAKATADKNAFLGMWNPLAPRYGQRTYSATGF